MFSNDGAENSYWPFEKRSYSIEGGFTLPISGRFGLFLDTNIEGTKLIFNGEEVGPRAQINAELNALDLHSFRLDLPEITQNGRYLSLKYFKVTSAYVNDDAVDWPALLQDAQVLQFRSHIFSLDRAIPYEESQTKFPKGNPFILNTLLFVAQLFIFFFDYSGCVVMSLMKGTGPLGYIKQIFQKNVLLPFCPAAAGWALADIMEVLAMGGVDPTLYCLLTQSRLVMTAIFSFFILRRKLLAIQWMSLCSLTMTLIVYALLKNQGSSQTTELLALGGLFTKCLLSVSCGVYGEKVLKSTGTPFLVQLSAIMTMEIVPWSILFMTMAYIFDWLPFDRGFFGGIDFGWDYRTVICCCFYVCRDFNTHLVVKKFDSIVKNIIYSVSALTTYLLEVYVFNDAQGSLIVWFLIGIVIFEVTNYSLAGNFARIDVKGTGAK